MKNLLAPAFFLLPFLLAAQVEFAPLGASWYFSYDYGAPWEFAYAKVEVTGIDTIQGRACKRIESNNHLGGIDWGCSPFYPLLQVYQENDLVYFYREGGFHLLYNFGAKAGESWAVKIPPFFTNDSLIVLVDSVYTIQLDGQDFKAQRVSFPNQITETVMDWGRVIVEGIGNLAYAAPQHGLCDPGIYGLRCYQNDSLELHLVPYPCDSVKHYSAITEPVLQGKLLFPNPANSASRIYLGDGLTADQVVLFNSLGQNQGNLQPDASRSMELPSLPPGIYWMQLFQGARLVGIDKLVVLQP